MRMPDGAVLLAIGSIVEIRMEGDGERDDPLVLLEADIAAVERGRPDIGIDLRPFELAGGGRRRLAGIGADAGAEDGMAVIGDDAREGRRAE